MTDPHKPADPRAPVAERPSLAEATIERRDFIRLGLGGAALLTGCGDDGVGGATDSDGTTDDSSTGDSTTDAETTTSTTTTTTSGSSSSSGATTGDDTTTTTGETTTTGDDTTDGGTTDDTTTGGADGCEGQLIDFDPEAIPLDAIRFPNCVMAGEMKPTSAMIATFVADAAPKTLRIWRSGGAPGTVALVHESEVKPTVDGYLKVSVDQLCPGTWYYYGVFAGPPDAFTARSLIGEFRTAIADDALEPLTLALASCNGSSLNWPSMLVTADEYYDMFIHLGDMAYNDGATTLAQFRASWRKYLGAEGYKVALARAGMYITWDDHEIDDNSNFDRETMNPQQLEKRQNALDAFFEVMPVDAEGPNYRLWRSFRWGLTAEIIVLDCRYERKPSIKQYISPAQMAFLKERLSNSPCHFKVIMNSVPITNMPSIWDVAANDRWEGFPAQRQELFDHIDNNDIKNVWFLSGDFHVCFVSRLEPMGNKLSHRTREIAVTSGNQNPIPELLNGLGPPQFDYDVHKPRAVILTLDPDANAVNVRFLDPVSGVDLYNKSLTQD